jgi:two-component system response regulator YesN
MYRLLIVEDEKWEREGLRDFLDWRSLGIDVAGCACNGAEGIKMAEMYRPDIIITDIMMPKMDGIQMSRNIHRLLPNTKIIVLSGYDDADFAKQSFSFHAFSYILKPVAKKTLEEVIYRVLNVLEQEEVRRREMETLASRWTNIVSSNKDDLLLGLLEGRIKIMNPHGPGPFSLLGTYDRIAAAILFLDFDSLDPNGDFDSLDPNGRRFADVIGQLSEIFSTRGVAFSFVKSYDKSYDKSYGKSYREAVLCMNASASLPEPESELICLMDEIRSKLDLNIIISVGKTVDNPKEAPVSYIQAREAGSYRFLAEYGELLSYSKIAEEGRHSSYDVSQLTLETHRITAEIIHSIQKSDMASITLLADDFLHILRQNPSLSKILISSFFTAIMSEANVSAADDTDITAFGCISQTKRYLLDFLGRIMPCGSEGRNNNEIEVVRKAIEIIEERYADELDLTLLSKEIHLTPYYIGSIFKKHTGKQFSQFLNDYRIQKAKELLHTKKIKVGRLAQAVGISNSSYFSLLFRKRFGISPDNYREIVKGGQEYV